MLIKKLLPIFLILLILPIINADTKYNRENSEKLMHLINWHEYTPETFDLAIEEQKPIYLVISAPAWCYWCHVYESEDYLFHPDVYPLINEKFIPIFVDSDKRPDLTKKYLEGGWPSTTIFTPNMMRITGFTGPRDPKILTDYFDNLIVYIDKNDFSETSLNLNYQKSDPIIPNQILLNQLKSNYLRFIKERYDPIYGGIGLGDLPEWREGQKFPKPLSHKLLLENYQNLKEKENLDIVKYTFENQYTYINEINTRYHLYDPVEGGFHRYSTNRDWTIPHYEKMLSDQALFLLTLTDLYNIDHNDDVKTALDGTINFVRNKFYDENTAFYSSQDAHFEEHYYGKTKEERAILDPPYIDKTIRMNSNSMMINSMFYLYNNYESNQNNRFKEMATQSLSFIQKDMINEYGVLFYYDQKKQKAFLNGQSLANSWALLAFIEGFETTKDPSYLVSAKQIADYSLNKLYDWDSGGFFNRNSEDKEFYAPNERIDLSKPYDENVIFAYGMLKLFQLTNQIEYLESGLKTMGFLTDKIGGSDFTYYFFQASDFIQDNNLIETYSENENEIAQLLTTNQKNFFIHNLLKLEKNQQSLDNPPILPNELATAGFIILIFLAFFSGILSFISPCTLPILTAYFAHNVNSNKGEMIKNTVYFVLGLALVFSIFGMGVGLLGNLFQNYRSIFTKLAGSIIILLGTLELFGKGFSGLKLNVKNPRKTKFGSFMFGIVFSVGWSACIGPILASLLLLSSTTGTYLKGSILLFIYIIGLAIPIFIITIFFDKIQNTKAWIWIKGKSFTITLFNKQFSFHTTYLIAGILLILIGILIFKDYLFLLNQYSLQVDFVGETIIKGEEFLKNLFIN